MEDISTETFNTLHKASANVTVSTVDGVTIASPIVNATTGSQVPVSASATDQLQVWDNTTGKKLGESR